MILPDPVLEEVLYVCRNMREMSREEIFGATDLSEDDFARFIHGTKGFKWVGYYDGRPAAILGGHRTHHMHWSLYGFGTDDWIRIWRPMTRCARQQLIPSVMDAGFTRADCITRADHILTQKWLKSLGATEVVPLPKWGKDGGDYVMLAWFEEEMNVPKWAKRR